MRNIAMAVVLVLLLPVLAWSTGTTEVAPAEAEHVQIWGIPNWVGEEYEQDSLELANEWAQEMFGGTFAIQSGIPSGSSHIQSLSLLLAEGRDLPDVMIYLPYNEEGTKIFGDLIGEGQLLPLTKYFNDPVNYPHLAAADKAYLRSYMYDGEIYAVPGFTWPTTGNYAPGPFFYIREDVIEKYGTPSTMAELETLLENVANDSTIVDADGNPVIPFGINPSSAGPSNFINFGKVTHGGGWEVDAQGRLMPYWAGEEFKAAMRYLNGLQQQGLLDPGALIQDSNKWGENLGKARYAVAYGWGNTPSYGYNYVKSIVNAEEGTTYQDHPDAAFMANHYMTQVPFPNVNAPGLVYPAAIQFTVLTADNPNPDATMKMIDWLISMDGIISTWAQGGILGEDWEYTNDEYFWQFIMPDGTPHVQAVPNPPSDHFKDVAQAAADPPKMLPVIGYVTSPAYEQYYDRVFYHEAAQDRTERLYGVRYWDELYGVSSTPLDVAVPSYAQVIADLPPQEASALSTAAQRVLNSLADVITADSFDRAYDQFIEDLIGVTGNWRAIYEARQTRWLDWMDSNGVDDRDSLGSSTPVAQWRSVMGW